MSEFFTENHGQQPADPEKVQAAFRRFVDAVRNPPQEPTEFDLPDDDDDEPPRLYLL